MLQAAREASPGPQAVEGHGIRMVRAELSVLRAHEPVCHLRALPLPAPALHQRDPGSGALCLGTGGGGLARLCHCDTRGACYWWVTLADCFLLSWHPWAAGVRVAQICSLARLTVVVPCLVWCVCVCVDADICSTCCSCVCFVLGRLFELGLLSAHSIATARSSALVVPAIYLLGFAGLHPPAVPFLGEALYPGVCGLMPLVVPLLRWPAHKRVWLLLALAVFSWAFLAAVFEPWLCALLGSHWTAPAVCFAMCDVLFLILAALLGIGGA